MRGDDEVMAAESPLSLERLKECSQKTGARKRRICEIEFINSSCRSVRRRGNPELRLRFAI